MLRSVSVVCVAVVLSAATALPSAAEISNPFRDTGPAPNAWGRAISQPKASTPKPQSPIGQVPVTQTPAASAVPQGQFPKQMDGGGRPSISPVAPPTVAFANSYGAGNVVIDTNARTLYYILSDSQALRYPISVGRIGFQWTGTQTISRMASWPDWRPPAEMRQRQPGLPEVMTGGVRNPLGAMALYLGSSLYRIHGTNDVATIGQAASSGCFRMTNGHVMHLASRVSVGAKVHVMKSVPSSNRVASGGSGIRPL
jgi:lipoprotein-anchoring transpeptidase ErfK/SrfK